MAAIAGALTAPRNNLPPAVILPEKLVHNSGRVIPGQLAGVMGPARDPMLIEASPFDPKAYGGYPEYEFDHEERPRKPMAEVIPGPEFISPRGVWYNPAEPSTLAARSSRRPAP